jgi:hypothetical protein
MRDPAKRWMLLLVLAVVLIIAFLSLSREPRPASSALVITLVGYTNAPGNQLQFALFCVSNRAPCAVRWRGSWIELEGIPDHKAETVNPSLPGFTREPFLKAGRSLRMAVGTPLDDAASGRWRFAMTFTPYTWRERWFDFSLRHKLPLRLASVLFGDTQRMLSPSNNVTVTTAWLTK